VNSLDTNVLVYAANADCAEHARARAVVDRMLAEPAAWVVADQVLWEFYVALRNPRILSKPCGAAKAADMVEFIRKRSGVAHVAYEPDSFDRVLASLRRPAFPYQRAHDTVLAVTLRHHGVETFYTRNTKDFVDAGFRRLVNPIDGDDAD
jgi:toxin-antitoxin system PIN domain toxin